LLLRSIEAKPRHLIFERNLPVKPPDAGASVGGGRRLNDTCHSPIGAEGRSSVTGVGLGGNRAPGLTTSLPWGSLLQRTLQGM